MSEELKEPGVEETASEDKKEPKQEGEKIPSWGKELMEKVNKFTSMDSQSDQGAQQVPVPNPPPPPEQEDEDDHQEPKTKNPLQKVLDWLM